jgi:hypothetical protein
VITYTLEVRRGDTWDGAQLFLKREGLAENTFVLGPETGVLNGETYLWCITAVDQYGATKSSAVWSFRVENQNPLLGWLEGLVYDKDTSYPVSGAQLGAPGLNLAMTGNGRYLGIGPAGTYSIQVGALGYRETIFAAVKIKEGAVATRHFGIQPVSDRDDDGYPDAVDAFPDDPDEWLDTDGDKVGDNADTDDDNDGLSDLEELAIGTDPRNDDTDHDAMTDGWEVSNRLNPLSDDSAQDLDGDGLTNLEEYLADTDPHKKSYPSLPWIIILLE